MRMKRTKSAAVAIVAAASIAGTAAPASAWLHWGSTTKYPTSGGVWTYGFWNVKVHSNYDHNYRCHGTTVKFWNGSKWSVNYAHSNAGPSANAALGAYNAWWTDDRYYYHTHSYYYC